MNDSFHTRIVYAHDHQPDHYREYYEGYRAIELCDKSGTRRGSLVWRLASGHSVEITEFGVNQETDRRKGWGTHLMDVAQKDMQAYFKSINRKLRRIYLFCEDINDGGRAFYETYGFKPETILNNFYGDCSAVLYVLEKD